MLITTSHGQAGRQTTFKGSQILSVHSEVVDALLKRNYQDRKDENNGWSKERHFRHVARLSPLAYLSAVKKYPDLEAPDKKIQDQAWRKVLMDPDFAPYRVVSGGL